MQCGADYVKLYQKAPDGLPLVEYPKYCSIDGDADRLVYFFLDKDRRFHMLDGDRFSVLFAFFLAKKLQEAKLIEQVKMGVIQTAYANGSSTDYIVKTMVILVSARNNAEQWNSRKSPWLVYRPV
jgi:phosphoacetylglucosamine mutase